MDQDTPDSSSRRNRKVDQKQPLAEAAGASSHNSDKPESISSGSKYVQSDLHKTMVEKMQSSLRRYVLNPTRSFFGKSPEAREQKRISEQIDQELKKYSQPYTFLVFGTEQSGKSTIIKQMRILYGVSFDEEETKEISKNIKQNIRQAILNILTSMSKLTPPLPLESLENQVRVDYLKNCASKPDFGYPLEFFEHIEVLWKDKGVQAAFERGNEYHLSECAKYFFDRVNIIKELNYTPTQQDILYCHTSHDNGIFETRFKKNYYVAEIPGPNFKRLNWTLFTENLNTEIQGRTALIFVAACDSYDILLNDDPTKNKLRQSIQLFNDVCSRWHDKSLTLFLNKQDLLSDKILAGKSKLEKYFPEFAEYQTYHDTYCNEHKEVVRAKRFIHNKFLSSVKRSCRCHFTCALDTRNFDGIFDNDRYFFPCYCYQSLKLQRYTL